LKEQLLLPFLLNKLKPDIVHFPHFNVPILWRGKFVVTIHDLIKHYSRGMETTTRHPWIYLIKYWGYKLVIKMAIEKAEKIIVPSNYVKKQIKSFYPKVAKKIQVTHEGIDEKFKNLKPIRQLADQSLKLIDAALSKYNIKQPFIIYVGNAYPHKNLRRLILAVKMWNQSVTTPSQQKVSLVISCSRDIFLDRLRAEVENFKAKDFINLTGFITDEDMPTIYSQAQAFVSASVMEGFGLPALEAMSVGCPVICSDIPVFREIYGNVVTYFNPYEADDIREKIGQVLALSKTQREKLKQGYKKQIKQYSWKRTAEETLKIYESCSSL
jgi:glycosyltransferase involved in cell wall biosynthesis